MKVAFYIDGNNFYQGLSDKIRSSPKWQNNYHWLDVVKFCEQFTGNNQQLAFVKFFTAKPRGRTSQHLHDALLKANHAQNGSRFIPIFGKYLKKKIRCKARGGCRLPFDIYEEKETDVNLSVEMIADCINGKCDTLVLISADSDLIPPMEFIRHQFTGKRIKIFFPPKRKSYDMIRRFGRVIFLENNRLKFHKAVMPATITMPDGSSINLPVKWT